MVSQLDEIERHDLFEDFSFFEFGFENPFPAAQIDQHPREQSLLILEPGFVLEEESLDDEDWLELPLLDLLGEALVVLA